MVPFSLKTKKIRILKIWKIIAGNILILHKCIKNHNHMKYCSWDTEWGIQNFLSILSHFLPFYPLTTEKNQNFEKMKKVSGDVIILHMCTENHNHMMYAFWDLESNGHDFSSFWTTFCPFTNNPKNQNFQKIKKYQEILSLYKCVP